MPVRDFNQVVLQALNDALKQNCRITRDFENYPYTRKCVEMLSTEHVAGAFQYLKDEIPKLKNAHTRVLQHFRGMDLDDLGNSNFIGFNNLFFTITYKRSRLAKC